MSSTVDHFQLFDGVLVPRMSPETWHELKTFSLRPDDVILSCYPRSGTHWAGHILKLLRKGGVDDDGVHFDDSVPWLKGLKAERGKMLGFNPNAAEKLPSPRTMRVHAPYYLTPGGVPHTTNIKYVYIARNPKDQCVLHWHFDQTQLSKLGGNSCKWDKFFSNFLEVRGINGVYGGWLKHVLGWWKHRDEPNILFLKYEDLQRKPYKTVQTIGEFLGVNPLTEELVRRTVMQSSFLSMSENKTLSTRNMKGGKGSITFLRKGAIGDWKNHFTAEQNAEFEEKIEGVLKEKGIDFHYE